MDKELYRNILWLFSCIFLAFSEALVVYYAPGKAGSNFLAALAALGLPWWLTHWLCWIQSLPAFHWKFQTKPKPCKIDGGHAKTWPDQQKDNKKDKDEDNDKYI